MISKRPATKADAEDLRVGRRPAESAFLGLDIGGQSVRGLRLESDGRISLRVSRPTPAALGAAAVLGVVREIVAELVLRGPALAVCAGTPGAVDAEGRIAGEAANIQGWMGCDLRSALEASATAKAFVRNDGNMAAYGEWSIRAEKSRAFLFVGLGTGIGGGFIENGRILSGVNDRALEIGHLIVRPGGRLCACGRSGCVEAYASGPSIGRIASELAATRREDTRGYAALLDDRLLDARRVYECYARGDELAREVNDIAADALAQAIGGALALLAPDTVVLGGGVMAGAVNLVDDIARLVPNYVYDEAWRNCRFEAALLGPDAGLVGAALYAAASCLGPAEFVGFAREVFMRKQKAEPAD